MGLKQGTKSYPNLNSQNNAKAGNKHHFCVTKLAHYFNILIDFGKFDFHRLMFHGVAKIN